MKIRVTLFLLFAFLSSSTSAIVIGGSNLGISGYPEHTCRKPTKPYKPYKFSSQWEVDSYNSEVDSYNINHRRYIGCVKEYLENAENDLKRIEEKMEETAAEAKRPSL